MQRCHSPCITWSVHSVKAFPGQDIVTVRKKNPFQNKFKILAKIKKYDFFITCQFVFLKLTYQTLEENSINGFIGQVKHPMFLNNYKNNILHSLSIEENVDHVKGE